MEFILGLVCMTGGYLCAIVRIGKSIRCFRKRKGVNHADKSSGDGFYSGEAEAEEETEEVITAQHLTTIKDLLLMRLLVEHGGQLAITYDALMELGREYDGCAVHLSGDHEKFLLTVRTPVGILERMNNLTKEAI